MKSINLDFPKIVKVAVFTLFPATTWSWVVPQVAANNGDTLLLFVISLLTLVPAAMTVGNIMEWFEEKFRLMKDLFGHSQVGVKQTHLGWTWFYFILGILGMVLAWVSPFDWLMAHYVAPLLSGLCYGLAAYFSLS